MHRALDRRPGELRRVHLALALALLARAAPASVYYVSAATGDDLDSGLTPASAFASVGRVNALPLVPGDEVRFFCGEIWRATPLVITRSGALAAPIVISSHPAACADRPRLSGAQPVAGWVAHAASLWRADLTAGANAGRFTSGVVQLFRGATRLPYGRWPNLDVAPGGWASVDSQPSTTRLVDAALPAGGFAGAALHLRTIRWLIVNREVSATPGGGALDLAAPVSCWNGCVGWGYFLNGHLATLDREGEWFYDAAQQRLYLYAASPPADGEIEGSVGLTGEGTYLGGVVLGRHLQEEVAWVTLENLRIERWGASGITFPTNLEADENHDLVLRDLDIVDSEEAGIRLATWVWNAQSQGDPNGWRGGRDLTVERVTIERANHFGIDGYPSFSTFADVTLRDIARLPLLGRSGMGCGSTGDNCTENGDGIRLKWAPETAALSGRDNLVLRARLERIGMNGIDIFGPGNRIEASTIRSSCVSKGDCGAIRLFGQTSLAATPVHDVELVGNLIDGTLGDTDGCAPAFAARFGFGIYLDNYSRDVTVSGNTIVDSTADGLLFQRSTGIASDNLLFGNGATQTWMGQVALALAPTAVTLAGNQLVSHPLARRTLRSDLRALIAASNGNRFVSPYWNDSLYIGDGPSGGELSLAEWQGWSGLDGASSAQFWTQPDGEAPRARILLNDSDAPAVYATGAVAYQRLDGSAAGASVTLPARGGLVLVAPAGFLFADDLEGGDLAEWSAAAP